MKTPSASSSTVCNSNTWVNVPDGTYNVVWDGIMCAIPFHDGDAVFEVDGENFTGINTGIATVFGKMARVNRNSVEKNKKCNYDGSIDGDKLTLIQKEMVM